MLRVLSHRRTITYLVGLVALGAMLPAIAPPADAAHFYRNTSQSCSAADGPLTDDPIDLETGEHVHGPTGAVVNLLHNAFEEEGATESALSATGFDVDATVITITVGQAILWTWTSSHCHSVQTSNAPLDGYFTSGFHYPTAPPESPQAVPGLFDYPLLDDTPTLSFLHTFQQVGTYSVFCIHHASIGMTATVIVTPA